MRKSSALPFAVHLPLNMMCSKDAFLYEIHILTIHPLLSPLAPSLMMASTS